MLNKINVWKKSKRMLSTFLEDKTADWTWEIRIETFQKTDWFTSPTLDYSGYTQCINCYTHFSGHFFCKF